MAEKRWKSKTEELRYQDAFFFYVIKSIDEVLTGENHRLISQMEDYRILDEQEEIMRRYYNMEETKVRLTNYTASYQEIYPFYTPNLCIVRPFKLLMKKANRQHKLDIRRQELRQTLHKHRESSQERFKPMLQKILKEERYLSLNDLLQGESNTSTIQIFGES